MQPAAAMSDVTMAVDRVSTGVAKLPNGSAAQLRQGPLTASGRSTCARRQTVPRIDWNAALGVSCSRLLCRSHGLTRLGRKAME